jgi:ABC-2 type transport system permease protein
MRNVWWILKRDLGSYLGSPMGYVVLAVALAFDGLLYNALALNGNKLSEEVLGEFFFYASGVSITASVFVAMRLVAEERQLGTLTLISTAPVREYQFVLGKYLSGLVFLAVLCLLTLYMPLLLLLNGKVSVAHLLAGYLGLMLLSSAALALALVCSAIAPNQLVALVLGAGVVLLFILLWFVSKIASPPFEELIAYLSLHDKHFRPFMRGLISVQDVVFYVSLTYVALVSATRILEARRWQ